MNKRGRIGVVMGGPSVEHEVSLGTGKNVLRYLDKKKYIAKPVIISRKGEWPDSFEGLKKKFDLLFIALHGEYGEDGRVQKILDKEGIAYTGSGVKASKKGMDKVVSARIFKKANMHIPEFLVLKKAFSHERREGSVKKAIRALGLPFVVKPTDRGSSVGVSLVTEQSKISVAIKSAFRASGTIMLQKLIRGRELTCGVLEINGKAKPLLPTEIIPRNASALFGYHEKYSKGASKEITPPNLSGTVIKEIQSIALKVHNAIGARGYSRTDMFLDGEGNIFVLEINTLPGMTSTSLLPQEARAMGISFSELLEYIISAAWKS